MFAILLRPQNDEKIKEFDKLTPKNLAAIDRYYTYNRRNYYLIRGYVTRHGRLYDWTILPEYVLNYLFEWDPEEAATDWSQIVRLESS